MASGPITSWQIDGETRTTVRDFILGGSKITADGDCSHEIKRRLLLGRKVMTNLDSILKSRDITWPKGPPSQGYGFSSGHVWMWELDYKESRVLKNWCFCIVVLEKTFESTLDSKEIKPINPKGINPEYSLEGWCWSWNSNPLATWCKELIHCKRTYCWVRLKGKRKLGSGGWDG